jgi:uncharacterized tellurite resistance protein B-like protein
MLSNYGIEGFPAFNIALGKILIAAAWVDGDLNRREINCLKNLILQFPGITFEDWRKLKIYLAYPMGTREQDSVAKEFINRVYLSEHRKIAWNALITVLQADGRVNIEEKKFADELDSALAENSQSFFRKLKYFLLQHSTNDSQNWSNDINSRDRFIHEFFDNPVYFLFRKFLLKEDFKIPQTKPELQKICLYAAILCWVSNVDEKITLPELKSIRSILVETCGVSNDIAKCIQESAYALDISEVQLNDLTKSLRNVTSKMERNELFMAISGLIVVDKEVSDQELECIRTIAVYLEISNFVWVNTLNKIVNVAFSVTKNT